jgi:hypothetical protein
MSETDLVRGLLGALAMEPGVIAWRNNSGVARVHGSTVRYGLGVGSPDIICCVAPYGRLVGLEAKAGRGKQEPEQKIWQAAIEEHGGYYDVVRTILEGVGAVRAARARPQGWNPWGIK